VPAYWRLNKAAGIEAHRYGTDRLALLWVSSRYRTAVDSTPPPAVSGRKRSSIAPCATLAVSARGSPRLRSARSDIVGLRRTTATELRVTCHDFQGEFEAGDLRLVGSQPGRTAGPVMPPHLNHHNLRPKRDGVPGNRLSSETISKGGTATWRCTRECSILNTAPFGPALSSARRQQYQVEPCGSMVDLEYEETSGTRTCRFSLAVLRRAEATRLEGVRQKSRERGWGDPQASAAQLPDERRRERNFIKRPRTSLRQASAPSGGRMRKAEPHPDP
jgi:hypothetical protein